MSLYLFVCVCCCIPPHACTACRRQRITCRYWFSPCIMWMWTQNSGLVPGAFTLWPILLIFILLHCFLIKIKKKMRGTCFCFCEFFVVITWHLSDAEVPWELRGAVKVCVCVYTENPLSLCFSISFLSKIRLFKSHYAQLSSVPTKPLCSMTSSGSESGRSGESGLWESPGLLFSRPCYFGGLWNPECVTLTVFLLVDVNRTLRVLIRTLLKFFDNSSLSCTNIETKSVSWNWI